MKNDWWINSLYSWGICK